LLQRREIAAGLVKLLQPMGGVLERTPAVAAQLRGAVVVVEIGSLVDSWPEKIILNNQ
jgi:hypothetical protein